MICSFKNVQFLRWNNEKNPSALLTLQPSVLARSLRPQPSAIVCNVYPKCRNDGKTSIFPGDEMCPENWETNGGIGVVNRVFSAHGQHRLGRLRGELLQAPPSKMKIWGSAARRGRNGRRLPPARGTLAWWRDSGRSGRRTFAVVEIPGPGKVRVGGSRWSAHFRRVAQHFMRPSCWNCVERGARDAVKGSFNLSPDCIIFNDMKLFLHLVPQATRPQLSHSTARTQLSSHFPYWSFQTPEFR